MSKFFRITAYLEGVSFLVLLGVAMPLKYIYGNPIPVKIVGWVHGLLFMAYIALLSSISAQFNWPFNKKILGLIAGVTPFGPFLFERYINREG